MKTQTPTNTPGIAGATLSTLGGVIAFCVVAWTATAAPPPSHEDFRRSEQTLNVENMKVVDVTGATVGRIADFAIDLEQGRVVEIIVSYGGFLGFSQHLTAVPPGALHFDTIAGVARLKIDKEKFKAAPQFTMSQWAAHNQSSLVAEDYRYYGQEPYFASDGVNSATGNTKTEPLGYIQRSSKLLYCKVKNLQNESLGFVQALIINIQDSTVDHVIVQSSGFYLTKSVIPARALRFNETHDVLQLNISKLAFRNEPRFKYLTGGSGSFIQETYSNTKVEANDGVNTRQNVKEGLAKNYVALAQGDSFDDADLTRQIYAAIKADPKLSANAQNVEVGTLNGRITLRGHVNTEDDKYYIGEIASDAGHPENVSNLLEVRPPTLAQ